MLEPTSILRQLPRIIPPLDRLHLEALVFAQDVMEVALSRLHHVSVEYAHGRDTSDAARIALFSDVWTIVDGVHSVRQILCSLAKGNFHADTKQYIEGFSSAAKLRNKMDHLAQNFQNRLKISGFYPPTFGIISYYVPQEKSLDEIIKNKKSQGNHIIIGSGTSPQEKWSGDGFPKGNIFPPVSSFLLRAFDDEIYVDEAVTSLRPIISRNSESVRMQIENQVDELAVTHGVSKESLLAGTGGSLIMNLQIELEIALS